MVEAVGVRERGVAVVERAPDDEAVGRGDAEHAEAFYHACDARHGEGEDGHEQRHAQARHGCEAAEHAVGEQYGGGEYGEDEQGAAYHRQSDVAGEEAAGFGWVGVEH